MNNNTLMAIMAVLGLYFMGGNTMVPRGIKNNNPFNIKKGSSQWVGKISGNDSVFETFDTMEHGVRAGFKLLNTYNKRYGLNTIRGILNRFAPTTENPTEKYIAFVSSQTGISPDEPISTDNQIMSVGSAIIRFENGRSISNDVIVRGYQLAQA